MKIEHNANVDSGDYRVIDKGNGVQLHLIPEELDRLNQEIVENGPQDLREYIMRVMVATGPKADWITALSATAAYCGILLNGKYDAATLNKVADECYKELRRRRVIVVKGD